MQLSWIKTDVTINLASPWSPLNPECLDYLHLYVECPWNWKHLTAETEKEWEKREWKRDRCAQTCFAWRHFLLKWKGRNWEEQPHLPRTVSAGCFMLCLWVCVCSLMMGTLKVLICVVREEAYVGAGVPEVRFSSLQEPFTWGDRRVFGLAECEWECLGVKQSR